MASSEVFVNLKVDKCGKVSLSILPYPKDNEQCGKLLLNIINNNDELKDDLAEAISVVKTVFPTKHNQNKFMLGMGIERLFTEIVCSHSRRHVIELCNKNETRVDITVLGKFPFSLKYSTPSANGSLSNVRLVNKHSTYDKVYQVHFDILIVVPSSKCDPSYVYDFESNRFCKIETKKAQRLIQTYGQDYVNQQTHARLCGKLVYIPAGHITRSSLKETQDGIELSSKFLNDYVRNVNYSNNIINLDILQKNDMPELDIIKIGLETALGMKFRFC
jgi:hypothetical protein